MQPGQADFAPEGYTEYTYSAEKKGYSGTACWCKTAPLAVSTGIGREEHDHEGRVLTLEYPGFAIIDALAHELLGQLAHRAVVGEIHAATRRAFVGLCLGEPLVHGR